MVGQVTKRVASSSASSSSKSGVKAMGGKEKKKLSSVSAPSPALKKRKARTDESTDAGPSVTQKESLPVKKVKATTSQPESSSSAKEQPDLTKEAEKEAWIAPDLVVFSFSLSGCCSLKKGRT